jgi:hypothetical protein
MATNTSPSLLAGILSQPWAVFAIVVALAFLKHIYDYKKSVSLALNAIA